MTQILIEGRRTVGEVVNKDDFASGKVVEISGTLNGDGEGVGQVKLSLSWICARILLDPQRFEDRQKKKPLM